MKIEKALSDYTDKINASEEVDLTFFEKQLSAKDFKEFLELIDVVKLAKAVQVEEDFDMMFEKLDKLKNELYTLPQAAGFKHTDDVQTEKQKEKEKATDLEAIRRMKKFYEEEFGEDGLQGPHK